MVGMVLDAIGNNLDDCMVLGGFKSFLVDQHLMFKVQDGDLDSFIRFRIMNLD